MLKAGPCSFIRVIRPPQAGQWIEHALTIIEPPQSKETEVMSVCEKASIFSNVVLEMLVLRLLCLFASINNNATNPIVR